jgi:hypothetical protein
MVRPLREQWSMRIISLVLSASLALAGPGCTVIGGAAGAAVTTPQHSTTPHHRTSRDRNALVGGMIGLAIDVVTILAIKQSLDRPLGNDCHGCN